MESLSQGTPVICSEQGGTKELVQDFGLVVKEAARYDYELVDYNCPPAVDVLSISNLPDVKTLGKSFDVSMHRCLKSYVELFENTI